MSITLGFDTEVFRLIRKIPGTHSASNMWSPLHFFSLSFFINWDLIGGEGAIDLVFQTDSSEHDPDKLPNTGFLTFDGVTSSDKAGFLFLLKPQPDFTDTIDPIQEEEAVDTETNIISTTTTDNVDEVDTYVEEPVSTAETEEEETDSLVENVFIFSNPTDVSAEGVLTNNTPLSSTFVWSLVLLSGIVAVRRRYVQ